VPSNAGAAAADRLAATSSGRHQRNSAYGPDFAPHPEDHLLRRLGALLAGFAVLAVLGSLDICPRLDEGGISCVSPAFEVIASIAMAIVLLSVFMGLPTLLALGGLIFLAFDLLRRWRKWQWNK
jgi:hypothetical protein